LKEEEEEYKSGDKKIVLRTARFILQERFEALDSRLIG